MIELTESVNTSETVGDIVQEIKDIFVEYFYEEPRVYVDCRTSTQRVCLTVFEFLKVSSLNDMAYSFNFDIQLSDLVPVPDNEQYSISLDSVIAVIVDVDREWDNVVRTTAEWSFKTVELQPVVFKTFETLDEAIDYLSKNVRKFYKNLHRNWDVLSKTHNKDVDRYLK